MATAFEQLKQKSVNQATAAPAGGSAFDALKAKPASTAPVSQETDQKDGFVKSVIKGTVKPVATMVARPIQALAELGGASADKVDEVTKKIAGDYVAPVPRNATDVVKDIGRGAETVALGLGGGAVRDAAGNIIKQTAKTAIKRGAIEGAKAGGVFGAGSAVEESGKISDAIEGGVKGAIYGGATGALIPAVGSKVKNVFGRKAAQKAEETALLASETPDARVATKALDETTGKIVKDKVATEAVKQGLPEADVAVIKNATAVDKTKMQKMLDIREKGAVNKRVVERATDVVGDTFMNQANHIAKTNKEAAKTLNMVAQRLAGKRVNAVEPLSAFAEDMQSKGIKLGKNKSLNFKGSDFEGLQSTQKTITNIWSRAVKAAKSGDALELHRLKNFIDEHVAYGKTAEGLSGRAETMVKGLRKGIDGMLDAKFPTYNKVNTQFAETIGQLHDISRAMGKKFKVGDTFSTIKAGTTLRRVLSQTGSRSDLLQLLDNMQKVGRKYGYKADEDIINQISFADTLESVFGSEAPTSFLGQIERGVGHAEDAASIGADLLGGHPIKAGLKGTKALIDIARGVNQKNKVEALRELIQTKATGKARTVFGNPLTAIKK